MVTGNMDDLRGAVRTIVECAAEERVIFRLVELC